MPSAPARMVCASTEPSRVNRTETWTLALVIATFIMCPYRTTWVSSQKPRERER